MTTAKQRKNKREYMRRYLADADRRRKHNEWVKARKRLKRSDPEWRAAERKRFRKRTNQRYRDDPAFRARVIAESSANYQRLRSAIVAAYGGKCCCCGETEPLFLEIDHVKNDGQAHRKATGSVVSSYRDIVRRGFPDDYRLLCANCNRGRQRNGGTCPHGHGV